MAFARSISPAKQLSSVTVSSSLWEKLENSNTYAVSFKLSQCDRDNCLCFNRKLPNARDIKSPYMFSLAASGLVIKENDAQPTERRAHIPWAAAFCLKLICIPIAD